MPSAFESHHRRKGVAYLVPKKPTRPDQKTSTSRPGQYRLPVLDPNQNVRLNIGIDFGTKNSAACYKLKDHSLPTTHGYDIRSLETIMGNHLDLKLDSRVAVVRDTDVTPNTWRLVSGTDVNEIVERQAASGKAVVVDLLKMAIVDRKSGVWRHDQDDGMSEDISNSHDRAKITLSRRSWSR
jgi:hypothetical protein